MPAFKKGQNPVIALTEFKKFMEDKISCANEAGSSTEKMQFLEEAHQEHFEKMGSLTTIYKGGNKTVDALKVEIRALYEQMLEMKQQNSEPTTYRTTYSFFAPERVQARMDPKNDISFSM